MIGSDLVDALRFRTVRGAGEGAVLARVQICAVADHADAEVLVRLAVAVIVQAVAGLDVIGSGLVDALDAERVRLARPGAVLAHVRVGAVARLVEREVFVDLPVAIVVEAVADLDDAGRGRLVDALVAELVGRARPRAVLAHVRVGAVARLTDVEPVVLDAVAVVVDAVTGLGLSLGHVRLRRAGALIVRAVGDARGRAWRARKNGARRIDVETHTRNIRGARGLGADARAHRSLRRAEQTLGVVGATEVCALLGPTFEPRVHAQLVALVQVAVTVRVARESLIRALRVAGRIIDTGTRLEITVLIELDARSDVPLRIAGALGRVVDDLNDRVAVVEDGRTAAVLVWPAGREDHGQTQNHQRFPHHFTSCQSTTCGKTAHTRRG